MLKYFIVFFLFCIPFSGLAQTKPTVAIMYAKSGDATEDFENLYETARFAFEQYNDLHHKNFDFSLVEIDDKNNPAHAQIELQKLLSTQKLIGIIGPLTSSVAMPLKTFIEKNKIPMVSIFATHNDLTKNSNYILRVCSPNTKLIKTMSEKLIPLIQKNKLNVIMFKDLSDIYSTDLADSFKKLLDKKEISVREVLFSGKEGIDKLKDIDSKVWSPTKNDILFLATEDVQSGKILTSMESDPYLVAAIEPVNFSSIVGKIKSEKTHIRLISTSQWMPGRSKFSRIIENAFKNKFKRNMSISSALTFDAAYAFASAYDRSLTQKIPLIKALKDKTKVEGLSGNLALGPDGERILFLPAIKEDLLQ